MAGGTDVVVIGGGVLGTSVGLHLLREGASCTILDRDGVAQGTSSAGAGFIETWAAGASAGFGAEELALEYYALDFYRELHERHPESPFRHQGCVWIAAEERDWPYIERKLTEGPEDARVVEPKEIEALTGMVSAAGCFRGVLRPSSAQASAEKATRAIAASFEAEGGRVVERRPVRRILVEDGRAVGVETAHGPIACETVVLAAGAWTNALLAELGVFLPMVPLAVSRIVTEPLGAPDEMPLLFIRSAASGFTKSMWVRSENGALMFGTNYETPAAYAFVDREVPERFDGLDLDGVLDVQRGAAEMTNVLPALGSYRNYTVKHGVPCYTPDGRSFVGAVPGIENLHVVAGCNEAGVTHGPGFGRVLADQITRGASDLADIATWRLDRFDAPPRSAREVLALL